MMKRIKIRQAQMLVIGTLIVYLFISFCNWDLNISEWNGVSRFFLASTILTMLMIIFDR